MGFVSDAKDKALQAAKDRASEAVEKSTPFGGFMAKMISMEKSAIAANHANDLMKDAGKANPVGTFRKVAGFVPDIAGDVANVATLGAFGHVRNVYNKVTSGLSLDFKGAKQALKNDPKMTIAERTQALLPDMPAEGTEAQADGEELGG